MSYVDLMANTRWAEVDHTNRTQAIVRAQLSLEEELILVRRVLGALIGIAYPALAKPLTPTQVNEVIAASALFLAAEQAGVDGRRDARKLHAALDVEAAATALAAIPAAPEQGDDPHAEARTAATAAHQALVNAASVEVLQLIEDRADARAQGENA